ncbi:MAG: hypothetical protein FJW30_03970 [Acidobacteria bacterium]|nr:hypothetical protein [Acidobacteriota bacterium]
MGFALWMTGDEALAAGTHEYRPMGCAVVARNGQFRPRDFRRDRQAPDRRAHSFVGLFGSLEEVNVYLRRGGRKHPEPYRAII